VRPDDRQGGFRRDGGDRDRGPYVRPDDRQGGFRRDGDDGDRGGFRRDGGDRPARPARPGGSSHSTSPSRFGGGSDRPARGGSDRPARGGSDRPARAGFDRGDRGSAGRVGDRGDRYDRPGRFDRDSRGSREGGSRPARVALPRIPDTVREDQLSREARSELSGLPIELAGNVGRYLVAAELATDPEQAYQFAGAARYMASRIGMVREVVGIAAYRTERWSEALAELRAARRMTGRNDYLAVMADSERALGRLDRALELVHSPEARRLPRDAQIELRIVESGIRRDQGLAEAAVLVLQVPELTDGKHHPWSARLFYAYAEALLAAGQTEAARKAFGKAIEADPEGETDAIDRLDEVDGVTVSDLAADDDDLEEDELDEDEADDLDATSDDELDDEDDEEDLDDKALARESHDEDEDDLDADSDEDDVDDELADKDDLNDDEDDDGESDDEDDEDNDLDDDDGESDEESLNDQLDDKDELDEKEAEGDDLRSDGHVQAKLDDGKDGAGEANSSGDPSAKDAPASES
jgi:tetratricopeptide (TPR) repeat protein